MGGAPSRGSSGEEVEQNKKVDDANDQTIRTRLDRATSPGIEKVAAQSSVSVDESQSASSVTDNGGGKAKAMAKAMAMAEERDEAETAVERMNEGNNGTASELKKEGQATLLDEIEAAMASDGATRSRSKRYIIDAPLRQPPANYRYDANGKLRKVL